MGHRWVGHAGSGWGGSCRGGVGWVMQGWGGLCLVGWIMVGKEPQNKGPEMLRGKA